MIKRFHKVDVLSLQDAWLLRSVEVDIGIPSDFLHWWRRNRLDDRSRGGKYLFTWTYVSDRSRVYTGSFQIVRSVRWNFSLVYVDFCSRNARDMTYALSEFESVFFGGVSNSSRPPFGMCVTITVK